MMVLLSVLYDIKVSRSCTSQVWALESVNTSQLEILGAYRFIYVFTYCFFISGIILSQTPTTPKKTGANDTTTSVPIGATFTYFTMSAKHQENDTPVKASHLLVVDCGVSSSGSRTLSVGGAPQAREICVVPQEQCGVVTLCDLPGPQSRSTTV